ncbi:MAG TPA: LamG-like jellyroll fold domain-containing protein, partial [Verrucomicrobiae bacterium]
MKTISLAILALSFLVATGLCQTTDLLQTVTVTNALGQVTNLPASVLTATTAAGETNTDYLPLPPAIRAYSAGAIADYGLLTVKFTPHPAESRPVSISRRNSATIAFRPTYIALVKRSTGDAWILGQVTNSVLEVSGSDVLWREAFDSISADLRYSYGNGSRLEQFITIREKITLPKELEDCEADVDLECWTEFFLENDLLSVQETPVLLREAQPGLPAVEAADQSTDLGNVKIPGGGRAFGIGEEEDTIPVAKTWIQVGREGAAVNEAQPPRRFLCERADWLSIKPKLDKLPKHPGHAALQKRKTTRAMLARLAPPAAPAQANPLPVMLARNSPPASGGLVIDFAVVAPPGLIAWWRGEGNAEDSAGAFPGTVWGGMGYAAGEVGQGFNLDGADDWVSASSGLNFGSGADFSIEAWIKPIPAYTTYGIQMIVDKRDTTASDSGAVGYALYLVDGRLGCQITEGPSLISGHYHAYGPVGNDLRDNSLHHIAMAVDRDSGFGLTFYIDGSPVQSYPATEFAGDLSSGSPLRIGKHATSWVNAPFKGVIDELSIYNRVLSQEEIQSIVNAGADGKALPPAITTQPASQNVVVGANVTFTVAATGTAPLTYQWRLNGVGIPGATASSYLRSNVQVADQGYYSVLVTNIGGSAVSDNATLTVSGGGACVNLPAGLVSWWRAEGNASDATGLNPGTLMNGATFGVGEVGQGFTLNGASRYVRVPSSASLQLTQGFTIECWYKDTGSTWYYGLIAKRSNTSPYTTTCGINIWPSHVVQLYFLDPTCGSWQICDYSPVPAANVFHHIAGTYRQSDSTHVEVKLYIDGACVKTVTKPGNLANCQNDVPVTLGASYEGGEYLVGVIDEVAIYNRALSSAEIQGIYGAGTGGKCPDDVEANPSIQLASPALTYTEQQQPIYVDQNAYVSDADSPDFDGGVLTVDISGNPGLEDHLSLTPTQSGLVTLSGSQLRYDGDPIGSVSGGWFNAPLVVHFTNTLAVRTVVQDVTRCIAFENKSHSPESPPRTVRMVITDGDGGTSLPATRTINIVAVKDPPVITLSGARPLYIAGDPAVPVDPGASVYDPDSTNFHSMTVTITQNADVNDRLQVRHFGSGAGQIGVWNQTDQQGVLHQQVMWEGVAFGTISGIGSVASPLVITFEPNSPLAAVDALVRSISFRSLAAAPPTGFRSVQLSVKDTDQLPSSPVTKTVEVAVRCSGAGLDVMLVIDRSGSMNGEKLTAAKTAAWADFAQRLSYPSDKCGVVSFSGPWEGVDNLPTLHSPLTSIPSSVQSAITGVIFTTYGTYMGSAIEMAMTNILDPLFHTPGNIPVMVLLTDGIDWIPEDGHHHLPSESFATSAKQTGIRIITIGLGNDVNAGLLQTLASLNPARPSGHDYYSAATPGDLDAVYSEISYSLCRGANNPPTVNIGADQCTQIASDGGPAAASVGITADDDHNPPGSVLQKLWSAVSGPESAVVTFEPPDAIPTTVHFTVPGIYTLRFTANDTELSTTAEVRVFVFPYNSSAPLVEAGPPQTTTVLGATDPLKLSGAATFRSGSACATPAVQWTQDQGPPAPPAIVTFDSPNNPETFARGFTQPGEYTFKLSAGEVYDKVKVTVCSHSEAPGDIALLFDASDSFASVFPQARIAVNTFVDLLDPSIYQTALLSFCRDAEEGLWQPLSHDKTATRRAINTLQPSPRPPNGTRICMALRLATAELCGPNRNPAASPAIIIFSDGIWSDAPAEIEQVADAAKAAGIRIITVGMGDIHPDYLAEVASCPEDFHTASTSAELIDIYAGIARSFCLDQNRRPVVYAGPNRTVDMRDAEPVQLNPIVHDDYAGPLTYQWENITQPPAGTVSFSDPAILAPTVTFDPPGSYTLKLTVLDGPMSDSSTVTLTQGLNTPPSALRDIYLVPGHASASPDPPHPVVLHVLRNDVDADGDALHILSLSTSSYLHGTVELLPDCTMVRYTPEPDFGGHLTGFSYEVSDGHGGTSLGTVDIFVLPANHPPKANDDLVRIPTGSMAPVVINVLTNDTDPDPIYPGYSDQRLLRIVSCTSPPAGKGTVAVVDSGFGSGIALRYTPPAGGLSGTATFAYTIADHLGAASTASVTVEAGPHQHPTANSGPDQTLPSSFPFQTRTYLQGSVIDDGLWPPGQEPSVEWLTEEWPVNGSVTVFPINDPGAAATFLGDGVYRLRLRVHEGTSYYDAPLPVTITVATDNSLIAIIENLHDGDRVSEGFFKVLGAADDTEPGGNFLYRLEVLQKDGSVRGELTKEFFYKVPRAPGSTLGTMDFTTLENDYYSLRLTVRHAADGPFRTTTVPFILDSPLKLGRLTFTEQDVSIPVGGLPLTVTRTYDSFNVSNVGAFGPGWTYSLMDMNVTLDEYRTNVTYDDGGGQETLYVRINGGRDVTLNLPDGRRTTFWFTLRRGMAYHYAEWVSTPGVFATIKPTGDNQLSGLGTLAWKAGGYHTPDENYDFPGFVLEMPDKTCYEIDRELLGKHFFAGEEGGFDGVYIEARGQPQLKRIVRPDGETIVINPDRIDHYHQLGPGAIPSHSIIFQRNDARFPSYITGILDPNTANGIDPVVKYEYNEDGDLHRVSRLVRQRSAGGPAYATTTYAYREGNPLPPPHHLTSITDSRSEKVVQPSYYSGTGNEDPRTAGRLKEIKNAKGLTTALLSYDFTDAPSGWWKQTTQDYLGNTTEQQFDSRGNVRSTRDACWNTNEREFDDNNNLLSQTLPVYTTYAYDGAGNLYSESRNSGAQELVSQTFYNPFGQPAVIIDPLSHAQYGDSPTVLNEYDAQARLTKTTDALDHQTAYEYFTEGTDIGRLWKVTDPLLNTVEYAYDTRGNITSQIWKNSTGQTLKSSACTYDANNNLLSDSTTRTLPSGAVESVVTTSEYDPQNRLIKSVDPLRNATTTFYNSIGKVSATIDPLSRVTYYFYDETGDLVKTEYPDHSLACRATHELPNGGISNRVEVIEDQHAPNEPNIKGVRHIYDGLGRVIQTERVQYIRMSVLQKSPEVTTTSIDETRYTVIPGSATISTYDAAGRVHTVTDPRSSITTYAYDLAGRLLYSQRVNDRFVTEQNWSAYDENGNVVSSWLDSGVIGSQVGYEYDALNRRTKVIAPDVANVHDPQHPNVQATEYDDLGRVSRKIDQAGIITGFAYDGLGRLTSVTNAAGTDDQTVTSYAYDEAGNLTRQIDALGHTTWFTNDAAGRRVSRKLPLGQTEYFTYDAAGNCTTHKDFNGKTNTFEYDSLNRLKKKTQDPSLGSFHVDYTYTANGKRKTVSDSTGRLTTYEYDNRDRLERKISPEGGLKYTYDNNGNVETVQSVINQVPYTHYAGGISLRYDWDSFNRLKAVTDVEAEPDVLVAEYNYDDVDRLEFCRYVPLDVTNLYAYTEANWLAGVSINKKTGSTF